MLYKPQVFQTQNTTTTNSSKTHTVTEDNGEVDILENKERSWFDLYRIVIIFISLLMFKVNVHRFCYNDIWVRRNAVVVITDLMEC